jgi:cytoskeletal protein CcmA (bactofilin family)
MAAKEMGGGVGNNTVIGQSILISGKLTGDEDLTVQGRAEGELTLPDRSSSPPVVTTTSR